MQHPNPQIEAMLGALASPRLKAIDLSLDRVHQLLAALGNPQERLPPVVHVAGTNGKGSLLAYLTAILTAAGYKVHRFISPHLVSFNERIMIAGKEISDDYLLALLKKISAFADTHAVTFFEANAVMAFLAFAENPADIVLLETGLGGRLDATNTVRVPALTAITPISMDHSEFLGETITAIATEKAGIIKKNVPCVTGLQTSEAAGVIGQAAHRLDAPLYRAGIEWQVQADAKGFSYVSAKRNAHFPHPNLSGAHQIYNAATAVACLDCLKGFAIQEEHIVHGITRADWPARLQRLTQGSLAGLIPEKSELWLDGGHNPGAGEVLADWIKSREKPVHLICGMLQNKDAAQFFSPLAPYTASLTAIPIEGNPSYPVQELSTIAQKLGIISSYSAGVEDALKRFVKSKEMAEEKGGIILICGSLYLAGNILWQNSRS